MAGCDDVGVGLEEGFGVWVLVGQEGCDVVRIEVWSNS